MANQSYEEMQMAYLKESNPINHIEDMINEFNIEELYATSSAIYWHNFMLENILKEQRIVSEQYYIHKNILDLKNLTPTRNQIKLAVEAIKKMYPNKLEGIMKQDEHGYINIIDSFNEWEASVWIHLVGTNPHTINIITGDLPQYFSINTVSAEVGQYLYVRLFYNIVCIESKNRSFFGYPNREQIENHVKLSEYIIKLGNDYGEASWEITKNAFYEEEELDNNDSYNSSSREDDWNDACDGFGDSSEPGYLDW